MTITCPCNGALASGPFSCQGCQRKAKAKPGVDRTKQDAISNLNRGENADSVRGLSVAAMKGRVVRPFQGICLPDMRHMSFDPNGSNFLRCALHESAHAVVAQTLGCRVECVHPGPVDAYVQHAAPDNPHFELAIKLAGWAGEHLVLLPDHAPARPLGGQDAIDVERCLDSMQLQGDARRTAIDATTDVVRSCLVAHAEAWDALLWRLVQAPMRPLDGAIARRVMSTGDPRAAAA